MTWRLAQPAAMADHQPAMRAQHREMVGDVLRVRRADADIDDGDAVLPVAAAQMVGRHLEPVPWRRRHLAPRPRGRRRAGRRRRRAAPGGRTDCRGSASSRRPSGRTGRHSAGSWSAGSTAGSCASRCRCNAPAVAANNRPAPHRTAPAAAARRSRSSHSPSAISSPTADSIGRREMPREIGRRRRLRRPVRRSAPARRDRGFPGRWRGDRSWRRTRRRGDAIAPADMGGNNPAGLWWWRRCRAPGTWPMRGR